MLRTLPHTNRPDLQCAQVDVERLTRDRAKPPYFLENFVDGHFSSCVELSGMNLADHPNMIVSTANDEEARAFLEKLGVLQKLEPVGANDSALPNQTRRLEIWDHPTHWISAVRFSGFSQAGDNGYLVRCLPKSLFTRAKFEQHVEAETQEMFPYGHTKQKNDLPPTGSN